MTVERDKGAFGAPLGSAFGAMAGGCALAVRLLALLLALALAIPEAGLAADLHHHLETRSTSSIVSAEAAVSGQAADPGLATHLHCGCHVAAAVGAADPVLPAVRPLPRFGREAEAVPSIVRDLLPRPPRA